MRISCWIPKATNTHSEYVIIIDFFLLQQWLHLGATLLRYIVHCLASLVLSAIKRSEMRIRIMSKHFTTVPGHHFNDLKPSGYYMYHQFNIQQLYALPTQFIYVFCFI